MARPDIGWYKRYPDKALSGMMGLTLEERGAYGTILDLIYSRAGQVPDDIEFLRQYLGCDVRVARRVIASLVGKGKLEVRSGVIHNGRADEILAERISQINAKSAAGRTGAEHRWGETSGEDRAKVPRKFGGSSAEVLDTYGESEDKKPRKTADKAMRQPLAIQTLESESDSLEEDIGAVENLFSEALPDDDPEVRVVAAWNDMAKASGLATITRVTDKRRRSLRARLGDYGLDPILAAIKAIPTKRFLMGHGSTGWQANFDWLLRPDSVTRLEEGTYDKSGRGSGWGF